MLQTGVNYIGKIIILNIDLGFINYKGSSKIKTSTVYLEMMLISIKGLTMLSLEDFYKMKLRTLK